MRSTSAGAIPVQILKQLIEEKAILPGAALATGQLQPASMDLRLANCAYRVRASFLPGKHKTVAQCLEQMTTHKVSLEDGAVLERGCVYVVEIQESLALPREYHGAANPKSSTGRLNVFTRLITDYSMEFEQIAPGYHGKLYAEITPLTFSVMVRKGSSLSQLRLRRGHPQLSNDQHLALQHRYQLINTPLRADEIKNGIPLSVDLQAAVVGYRAKRHSGVIDIDNKAAYPWNDFWEPITTDHDRLILDPGEFYILASREKVTIPTNFAAEMVPYDAQVGEFRVHYAGFFDPGFGDSPNGAHAVLEVRSFDIPFILQHGQKIGRLIYEKMLTTPGFCYGSDMLQSHYQSQRLQLSKHFIAPE